ncbi:MAG: LacI family DNA-binding transcriptional regulator [Bacillota bacterium]
MKVTIKDIARKAGVSVTTVSRVINNKPDVSSDTKKKVEKIIDETNYQPNTIARGLVLQKSYTIGLIIPDISNPFFPEVARGIEDELRKEGYSVIFCNTDNRKTWEKESIDLLRSKQVDGMILSLSYENCGEIFKLEKEGFPVVQLDRLVEGSSVPSIAIDNTESAYTAAEYLISRGHKKIAHITGDLDTNTGRCRAEGFKRALQDYNINLPDKFYVKGDYSRSSGYYSMKKILQSDELPTAVFTGNDLMAMGVYEAIFDAGLEIPDDISVFGHDDIDLASLIRPGLTTMRQPKYRIGKLAAEVLLGIINKNKAPNLTEVVLKTELIERESVKSLLD